MANINRILSEADIRPTDVRWARQCWRSFRVANGWAPDAPLLSWGNRKFLKDASVVTTGVSLAQANTVGAVPVRVWIVPGVVFRWETIFINTCPFSTPACRFGCVSQNGHAAADPMVMRARQLKTRFLLAFPDEFCTLLAYEIDQARAKYGRRLRVRLNTFSDIRWEEIAPWVLRSGGRRYVRFYDYTKDHGRRPPRNYRLTLSASERTTDARVLELAGAGATVAVVFSTYRTRPLPETFGGLPVIDGDKSDNRADDERGVVVGLRAKGKMRGDTTGMVRVVA